MRWKATADLAIPPDKLKMPEEEAEKYTISLDTPLLGGGVKSLEIDENMPIRVQSIRGHLRFWWRTFQKCESAQELFEKEEKIWGSTKQASSVKMRVSIERTGVKFIYYREKENPYLPKYVIFPLNNTKNDKEQHINSFTLMKDIKFNLYLTYLKKDRDRDEILTSLKLWLLFGGIGARTRRGMGSLSCPDLTGWKNKNDVEEWLKRKMPTSKTFENRGWPNLFGARLLITEKKLNPSSDDTILIWKQWIRQYEKFRQYRVNKKDLSRLDPYGISTWPEANAIRSGNPSDLFFPRAAYGLPIMFHFKNNPRFNSQLHPNMKNKTDRWASPVIIKTFKISAGTYLKICLKLNSKLPESFKLMRETGVELIPASAGPLERHSLITKPPLENNDPYTALLKAMGGKGMILGGEKK